MQIKVNLNYDSLQAHCGVLYGEAAVYLDNEITDFSFMYDLLGQFSQCDLDDFVFGEYIEVISSKLVQEIKNLPESEKNRLQIIG